MICLGSICLWDHYNLSMDERYIYIPPLNCKALFLTFSRVIAKKPLEYVTVSGYMV